MLYVIRHGETDSNASGLLLGRDDAPLNRRGHEQAAAVASTIEVERVVSSPLRRTVETASYLATPELDERFIELDYGELDGVAIRDVAASIWERWRTDIDFAPPGGESHRVLQARVYEALDELATEGEHVDVAVVSHVSPIKMALAWCLGTDWTVAWRSWVATASVMTIDVSRGRRILRGFNRQPTVD